MLKRIISAALSILLVLSLSLSAFAAHAVPDTTQKGSVSFEIKYNGEPVSGGSLTLRKVANVHVDNGNYSFAPVSALLGTGFDVNDMSAKNAKSLADYLAKNSLIVSYTGNIGKTGKLAFKNLSLGLYLIVQEKAAPDFSKIEPFFITVPLLDGENYVYDINATPKLEIKPSPTSPGIPQTGQLNWPVPVLAIMGMSVFALGWYINRSSRREQDT